MALLKWMGVGQTEKHVVNDAPIGLENFGNTCYCNSILQALYYCRPFRECVLNFQGGANVGAYIQSTSYPGSPVTPALGSSPAMSYFGPQHSPGSTPVTPMGGAYHSSTGNNGLGATIANGSHASATGTLGRNHQREASVNGAAQKSGTAGNSTLSGNLLPNGGGPDPESAPQESMFLCLQDLFMQIQNHSKKTQYFTPTAFVAKVKKENELFRSSMHQDAHEFLMFIISTITEDVEKEYSQVAKELERNRLTSASNSTLNTESMAFNSSPRHPQELSIQLQSGDEVKIKVNEANNDKASTHSSSTANPPKEKAWVQKLFEGQLTNEIKCLTCEKTTNRDESFMDLSLDIEQNSSVTSCLRQFSASEMLCHKDKFYCDECCGLQEAEKRMKIKELPNILSLHLKRFKYQEALQKYVKLSYRVSFPLELRLFNTVDDMVDPDRIYDLNAFVVHIGGGPHHGHYVAVVKHGDRWLLFDDDAVETIDEADIRKYFGDSAQLGSGYVLFYQARDLDMNSIVPSQQWMMRQPPSTTAAAGSGLFPTMGSSTASSIKSNAASMSSPRPHDLESLGPLMPHHQQQELIHQQFAAAAARLNK